MNLTWVSMLGFTEVFFFHLISYWKASYLGYLGLSTPLSCMGLARPHELFTPPGQ